MAGGRRNRGWFGRRNLSGDRMWLKVGETEECIMEAMYQEPDVAGGRSNIGQYGGRNVSGARMWLEVGETEDCMMEAM